MNNIIDNVHDLMKISDDELTETLLDEKYNKALLRELVRRSIHMANDYKYLANENKEKSDRLMNDIRDTQKRMRDIPGY